MRLLIRGVSCDWCGLWFRLLRQNETTKHTKHTKRHEVSRKKSSPMAELIYKDEAYAIAGAAMEVYYTLGIGFLEPVYQGALAIEFNGRGIPYVREPYLEIAYKGVPLNKTYRPDFV